MFLFVHLSNVQATLIGALVLRPCVTGFRDHEKASKASISIRNLFRGFMRL